MDEEGRGRMGSRGADIKKKTKRKPYVGRDLFPGIIKGGAEGEG